MSWLVGISSSVSLLVVGTALIAIHSMVADVSDLKDTVDSGMAEFKIVTEDTWTRLHSHSVPSTGSSDVAATFATFIGRNKRHSGSQCNCGPSSRGCPAGPPGVPGRPGERGRDGAPGQPGRRGANGIALSVTYDIPGGCISCPPGRPGPPGQPGFDGPSGTPGTPGERGPAGEPGQNGFPGEDGTPGQPGRDGKTGGPGRDGAPGVVYAPGQPGRDGNAGRPGPVGPPGAPGEEGRTGSDGFPGQDGQPGQPGRGGNPGPDGEQGADGLPGHDAAYCPCPSRSAAADGYRASAPSPVQGGYESAPPAYLPARPPYKA